MKKFKCTITKETTMEIEIDDHAWTSESIKEWSDSFYNADNLSEVVEHLAIMKSEHEDGEFIEGFGIPMVNGKKPYTYLSDDDVDKTINICSQESDIDIVLTEIKIYFLIISLEVLICRYSLYLQAFRHFSYRKMFLNILISPHVSAFKGSRKSSKTTIYYYAISRSISANALSEVA